MQLDPVLQTFVARCRALGDTVQAIYLFGSRATGRERPDSDYDVLLVVAPAFSPHDKDQLYEGVMDVLLATGRLVSLKIFSRSEFERLRTLGTPFMQHVAQEGIPLG